MWSQVNLSFSQSMWQTRLQADPEWSEILVFATKICIRDTFNYLFQLLLSNHHICLTCNIYEKNLLLHKHLCLEYVFSAALITVHSIFLQPQTVPWNLPWDIRQKRMTNVILAGFLMVRKHFVNKSQPANIYLWPYFLFSSFNC